MFDRYKQSLRRNAQLAVASDDDSDIVYTQAYQALMVQLESHQYIDVTGPREEFVSDKDPLEEGLVDPDFTEGEYEFLGSDHLERKVLHTSALPQCLLQDSKCKGSD